MLSSLKFQRITKGTLHDYNVWFEAFKGALDKHNIYLYVSYTIDGFKLNQYQNFQLILPVHFHFMEYFVGSIIYRVSHRLLYCLFIEVNFEK